jgi:hypothetical protein
LKLLLLLLLLLLLKLPSLLLRPSRIKRQNEQRSK